MLNGIFVLQLVTAILAVCVLACNIMHENSDVKSLNRRTLLSSILLVLLIIETIIASILDQSIRLLIVCIIIWALHTEMMVLTLKKEKEEEKKLNTPNISEDVIDVDCKEIQDNKEEKDET